MSVNSKWPKEVRTFEAFLRKAGLSQERKEEFPSFNNKVLQYGNALLKVRVLSDKSIWFVEVSGADKPSDWYDAALLRELLKGSGDDILSLSYQIELVEKNWPRIAQAFSPAERENTYGQLATLREERATRRFPGYRSPRKDVT